MRKVIESLSNDHNRYIALLIKGVIEEGHSITSQQPRRWRAFAFPETWGREDTTVRCSFDVKTYLDFQREPCSPYNSMLCRARAEIRMGPYVRKATY